MYATGMRLPEAVRAEFRRQGRRGGAARARRLTPDTRRAIARLAALRRWIRDRFGDPSFAALGLPGGATVDKGIEDLVAGRETCESLAVSLASTRLRRESVPLPATLTGDTNGRLFRLLEDAHGPLAHARYLARLREIASFADACRTARVPRDRHAS
jgi:hypothetical protein